MLFLSFSKDIDKFIIKSIRVLSCLWSLCSSCEWFSKLHFNLNNFSYYTLILEMSKILRSKYSSLLRAIFIQLIFLIRFVAKPYEVVKA